MTKERLLDVVEQRLVCVVQYHVANIRLSTLDQESGACGGKSIDAVVTLKHLQTTKVVQQTLYSKGVTLARPRNLLCKLSIDVARDDRYPLSSCLVLVASLSFFPYHPPERRYMLIEPKFFDPQSYDTVGMLRHELGHMLGWRHERTRTGALAICPDEDMSHTIRPHARLEPDTVHRAGDRTPSESGSF